MEPEQVSPRRPWHLILAAALSLAVLVGFYVVGVRHFSWAEWPEFGDFVAGAAGVILTALTFLALLYTIHIQSTELALSREELRLTREEMTQNREELARSAKALDQQVSAIRLQNFERTLFDSLNFLNNLVDQFEYLSPWEDNPRRGTQAFFSIYHRLAHKNVGLGGLGTESGDEIGDHPPLNSAFDQLRPLLGAYLRTLYNIYRFLDESEYSDRVYYNRIIRSQITDHGVVILFYNSLTLRGRKFQKYIVKYNILDNLPPDLLLNPHHLDVLGSLPTPNAIALEAA